MIGNRILMGVIENETLGSSPCDQKSHTDGESEISFEILLSARVGPR